jgi:hypothetical protein
MDVEDSIVKEAEEEETKIPHPSPDVFVIVPTEEEEIVLNPFSSMMTGVEMVVVVVS